MPELRPASTVPVVALVVALIGTLTCLILVFINYRKTRKVLMNIQRQSRQISINVAAAKDDGGGGEGANVQQDKSQVHLEHLLT